MYSFLLLAIPAATLCYCFSHSEYRFRNFLIPALTGMMAGILAACIKEFFIFSVYIPKGSVPGNMLHLFKPTFFPCLALCGLLTFFSKDDRQYKATALFPLISSFYAVYLPYTVISGPESRSFFLLFISPVLTLCTALSVQTAVFLIGRKVLSCGWKSSLPYIVLFPAATAVQPAIHALWHCKTGGILPFILAFFFAAAALAFHKGVSEKISFQPQP